MPSGYGNGSIGYGIGSFIRSYMDAKYREQALDKEQQRIDLAKRSQSAREIESGYVLDPNKSAQEQMYPIDQNQPQAQTSSRQQVPVSNPDAQSAPVAPQPKPKLASFPDLSSYPNEPTPHAGLGGEAEFGQTADQNKYYQPQSDPQTQGLVQKPVVTQGLMRDQGQSPGLVQPDQTQAQGLVRQSQPQAQFPSHIGDYTLTPEKLNEMRVKAIAQQRALDMSDPNSPVSEKMKEFATSLYNEDQPGRGDKLFKGDLSAQDLDSMIPMLQKVDATRANQLNRSLQALRLQQQIGQQAWERTFKIGQAQESMRHNQSMESTNQGRVNAMMGGNQIRAGGLNNQVSKDFDKDTYLTTMQRTENGLARGINLLQGNAPITAKDARKAFQDIIGAITASNQATEGQTSREMPNAWAFTKNDVNSWFGDVKDVRKDPEANRLLQQQLGIAKQIKNDITDQKENRAWSIYQGAKNNPMALQTAKDKLKAYAPHKYNQMLGGGGTSSGGNNSALINSYAQKYGLRPDQAETILRNRGTIQ